ncbi:MAG TPA: hypothetical protein VNM45_10895 [Bacillus sp. (in: firmicutes)]|nr:hypothetical protein [Bacillus sp. (in: firmicutes)]
MFLYFHLIIGLPILSVISGVLYQWLFKRIWLGALIAFFLPFWFIPYRFTGMQRVGLWFIFGAFYSGVAYAASIFTAAKQSNGS